MRASAAKNTHPTNNPQRNIVIPQSHFLPYHKKLANAGINSIKGNGSKRKASSRIRVPTLRVSVIPKLSAIWYSSNELKTMYIMTRSTRPLVIANAILESLYLRELRYEFSLFPVCWCVIRTALSYNQPAQT